MTRMQTADRAKELFNGGRFRVYAEPRHVLAWLLRSCEMSYPDIGAEMGGRDHTTAMHSVEMVGQNLKLLKAALVLRAKLQLEIEKECGTEKT